MRKILSDILPKGYPSKCHPDKPNYSRGMCSTCYQRTYRKPTKPAVDYELVAELAGITPAQAKKVYQTILSVMKDALLRGERVSISKFGSWTVKQNRHTGRVVGNPAWGGRTIVKKTKTVKFKPSPALLYMVNPQDFT